jgi:hypothetical protein
VRHDHCVGCSRATRPEFACFIHSFGRQLRDPLPARTCLQVQPVRMFLCETLTVRTRNPVKNKNSRTWGVLH